MRKLRAIVAAALVPFAVQFLVIFIGKSMHWTDPPELVWLLNLLVCSTAGFGFIVRAFRPLHAVAIGIFYFPLIVGALTNVTLSLGGGI